MIPWFIGVLENGWCLPGSQLFYGKDRVRFWLDSNCGIEVCSMSIATRRASTNLITSEGRLEETKVLFPLTYLGLRFFLKVVVSFPGKRRFETIQDLLLKYYCDVPGSLTYYCTLSASQDTPSWRRAMTAWSSTIWVTGMHAAKPGLKFTDPVYSCPEAEVH